MDEETAVDSGSSEGSGAPLEDAGGSDDVDIPDGIFVCEPPRQDVVARVTLSIDGIASTHSEFEQARNGIDDDSCEVIVATGDDVQLRCADINPQFYPPHDVAIAIEASPAIDLSAMPEQVSLWQVHGPDGELDVQLRDTAGSLWFKAAVDSSDSIADLDCEQIVDADGCATERVALDFYLLDTRVQLFDGDFADIEGWRIVVEEAVVHGDLLGNGCELERSAAATYVMGPAAAP